MTKNPAPTLDPLVIDPPHYTSGAVEAIEVTRHLPFDLGNAYKYIARAGHKPGTPAVQDYAKARWYLRDHIEHFGPHVWLDLAVDAPLRRAVYAERDLLHREALVQLLFGDIPRMQEAVQDLIDREDEPADLDEVTA